ncbi:MAG: hypothetical protein R3F14_24120 [Polyangiaceae bacterium]
MSFSAGDLVTGCGRSQALTEAEAVPQVARTFVVKGVLPSEAARVKAASSAVAAPTGDAPQNDPSASPPRR